MRRNRITTQRVHVGDRVRFVSSYGPGSAPKERTGIVVDVGSLAYPRNPTVLADGCGQITIPADRLTVVKKDD